MGMPQIILIILYCLSLGIAMSKHGQPKEDKYNFFYNLISTGIMIGLLIWGGFFN
ncbi:hypothetical protein [Clostridium botulinum]|uniref:hypothetical protein n=1 Tax=Clostridium botulinum TaxID=1491 RepID=UPI001C9AAC45|nr:hypothetical protein [Clostridium botulinum]MBY6965316.1 hypothetical protein [Clostridium botulinum]